MAIQPGTYVSRTVRLVRPLGQGGMGSVWVARNDALDAEVAVKFVSVELAAQDPTIIPRFRREAALAAKLKSPHVVKTFDHGVLPDGTPFIVMELLEGETLGNRLFKVERLSPGDTANIVSQVAQVLAEAHQLGVVHRDIKPDNVFLLDSAYDVFIKVLDFGIAKQTTKGVSNVTDTGTIVGTPEYMSPEQLLSTKSADFRADLWALAVLAYNCLTGEVPFKGETLPSLSIEICAGRFVLPSLVLPSLGTQLDAWFERAFEPETNRRFQSVLEMAETFRAIVRGTSDTGHSDRQPLSALTVSSDGDPSLPVSPVTPRSGTQVSAAPPPGISGPPPHIGIERARVDSGVQPAVQNASADASGRREAIAAAYEGQSPTISGAASTLEPAQRERRSAWVKLAAVLAACVVLAVGADFLLRSAGTDASDTSVAAASEAHHAGDKPAESAAAAADDPPSEPSAESSGEDEAEAEAVASASASAQASTKPAPRPRPAPRAVPKPSPRPAPRPRPSPSNCANPYVVQPDGSLKVKPECL